MNTLFKTIMTGVLLFLAIAGMNAQNARAKLNQVELLRKFIGSWKFETGKDTFAFAEYKSCGTGLEGTIHLVTRGKTIMEEKLFWGFDLNGKGIGTTIFKGSTMQFYSFVFTSQSHYAYAPYMEDSNPATASIRFEGEFKSPGMMVETSYVNDKPVATINVSRVK